MIDCEHKFSCFIRPDCACNLRHKAAIAESIRARIPKKDSYTQDDVIAAVFAEQLRFGNIAVFEVIPTCRLGSAEEKKVFDLCERASACEDLGDKEFDKALAKRIAEMAYANVVGARSWMSETNVPA